MKFKIGELQSKVLEAFLSEGFSEDYAERAADYIVWADMSGIKTHGVAKMIGPEPCHKIRAKGEIETIKDTKLSRLLDGNSNPGPVISSVAVDIGIEKAKDHGFAIVGVREAYNSSGALSYFVERAAKEDLISIITSRAPSNVSGFGTIDPLFGTNPITFGFPSAEDPVIFDMTTASITYAGMVVAKVQGKELPEGIAIDKDGNPTTDPEKAMKGAIFPFVNSHKGAGLSMVIEMLTGPLVGGAWIDNDTHAETWGSAYMFIDPDLLAGREEFKQNATDMVKKMKSARMPKGKTIRLPDERRRKAYQQSQETGEVEINDDVLRELGWL